jgi:hypothetical protein
MQASLQRPQLGRGVGLHRSPKDGACFHRLRRLAADVAPVNAGGAKGPDFCCAFEDGEEREIGDEPDNA